MRGFSLLLRHECVVYNSFNIFVKVGFILNEIKGILSFKARNLSDKKENIYLFIQIQVRLKLDGTLDILYLKIGRCIYRSSLSVIVLLKAQCYFVIINWNCFYTPKLN